MQQLGRYVVVLTVSAMTCGILLSLFPEGILRSVLQLVCGAVMTIAALSPLKEISLPELEGFTQVYIEEGQQLAAEGKALLETQRIAGIKQSLEAYILDKAAAEGADITARVQLDGEGMPVSVALSGICSEEARNLLSAAITRDLGIPGEAQEWTMEN